MQPQISLALFALLLAGAGCQALSVAQPLSDPQLDTISIYIKKTLENLREAMPQGIPQLKIPPLEPFSMPVIDIPHIKSGAADVQLGLKQFVLNGLSSFAVRHAKGRTDKMSIEIHLFFPETTAQAFYDLNGKVMIFPLYGKGPATIKISDLSINLVASVSIENMRKVQLNNLGVDLTFSQVQMNLEGIVGGGNLGAVVNTLLNSLGKLIYDKLKGRLLPEVSRILSTVINNELGKVNLQDILGGLLPFAIGETLRPVDESANNYVDKLMENLRPHIRQNNLDPFRIPDWRTDWSKKVALTWWRGYLQLANGHVNGLSTIHRAGNCDAKAEGTKVTVGCVIGINGLHGRFDAEATANIFKFRPNVHFGIGHARITIKVSADLTPGSKPSLENFSITDVAPVDVSVRGLDPLMNFIFTEVAKTQVNNNKHVIVSGIEGPIRNELAKVIGSIEIPKFS